MFKIISDYLNAKLNFSEIRWENKVVTDTLN
jgi:hypothetical protein